MRKDLISITKQLRKKILKTSSFAKIPHVGSCFSCLEILVYLYWEELQIDPLDSQNPKRDRFILSKGHGAPGLFQVLAEKNFFPKEKSNSESQSTSICPSSAPVP